MTKLSDFSYNLIKYIKERPLLYVSIKGSLNHNTNIEKKRQWEEIAELTKKTAQECKMRWKNMKDSYRKALKKQSEGLPFDTCYLEALNFISFYSEQEVLDVIEKINNRSNTNRKLANANNEIKVTVSDIVNQSGKRKQNKEDIKDIIDKYTDKIVPNKNFMKLNENINTANVYFESGVINSLIDNNIHSPCPKINAMDLQNDVYYTNLNDSSLRYEDNTALTVEDIQIEDIKTVMEPGILNLERSIHESEMNILHQDGNITKDDESSLSSNEIPSKHAMKTKKDSLLDRILVRDENKALVKIIRKLNKQNRLLKRRLLKLKSREPYTSTHSFFRAMADVVCKFPPMTIADVRMKVCTVVTSAEMENLQ